MAQELGTPIRDVDLTPAKFEAVHETFISRHNTPVIDTPLPPKYALAEASRSYVITGEGGDNFFGGPKNVSVFYTHDRRPDLSPGWLYALAHARFVNEIPNLFVEGEALQDFAVSYCGKLMDSYPGDLLRKLFYLNSLEKPASMIFEQSYFPAEMYGLTVRHPMAALDVYRAAFRVPDHKKFSYPLTKIALLELYGNQLPPSIVQRRKSGTVLPLRVYLKTFPDHKFKLGALEQTGLFRPEILDAIANRSPQFASQPFFVYGLITLNLWLEHHAACAPLTRSLAYPSYLPA